MSTLDKYLRSKVNDVILWYWYIPKGEGELLVEYLPLSCDERKMCMFKRTLNMILLSAEDNEVLLKGEAMNLFDSCRKHIQKGTEI
jgi:hypothetical protein